MLQLAAEVGRVLHCCSSRTSLMVAGRSAGCHSVYWLLAVSLLSVCWQAGMPFGIIIYVRQRVRHLRNPRG